MGATHMPERIVLAKAAVPVLRERGVFWHRVLDPLADKTSDMLSSDALLRKADAQSECQNNNQLPASASSALDRSMVGRCGYKTERDRRADRTGRETDECREANDWLGRDRQG